MKKKKPIDFYAPAMQSLKLEFSLKEGTNIEISDQDVDMLNDEISIVLSDIFDGDVEFNELEFGLDKRQDMVLTDEYIYEFTAEFRVFLAIYDYYYSPATMYDRYGDPGSPAEEDFEVDYDKSSCLENVDYDINEVKSELKKIPIIGDYIDLDTVEIDIKEVDWDTLEIKHDSYEDDGYYRD